MDVDSDHRTNGEDDVLDEITNMESKFYQQGYQDGFDHGKLHGLFEGRELGKEKAWELWEEVGFYQGLAETYITLLNNNEELIKGKDGIGGAGLGGGRKGKDARIINHAQILLGLIDSFPTINPSQPQSSSNPPTSTSESVLSSGLESKEIDLSNLISNIRSRYKLLCSSLNIKPRLQTAQFIEAIPGSGASNITSEVQEGIEGPVKGVDTRQLRF
ncbi:uncharacterized protein L201_006202 [Kwoniella dendrophila CBS 6074]|uniref:Essential protein Yae1 N-terminal domain-containing protein n=1 Tax=Kwoniella dendrophila CBS 6074 TaxID=1295534 RepID=A0AAX4K1J8_9TREE